jgi:DNA helicase-2/ATP-dependent DNA helicase PcrA
LSGGNAGKGFCRKYNNQLRRKPMKIERAYIKNFRILKEIEVDFEDALSVVIGKNNAGKTSFLAILEKFLASSKPEFAFDDFSITEQQAICALEDTEKNPAKKNVDGSIANKDGSATFLYSDNEFDFDTFKSTAFATGWDFSDPLKTKLLFLTHRLIAKRNGWDGILSAYTNNDMLLGDEPDRLANHLLKLGRIISSFQQSDYSQVLASITKKIRTNEDKRGIGTFLNSISTNLIATIEVVIKQFNDQHILVVDDRLSEYITNNQDRYDQIKVLPVSQILAYYVYYNSFSPYSTQHGIKGAEFDNVLVVMDNGRWNNYNFKYYFEGAANKETIISRTERIFYVCCSRAMNNLVVYYPSPTAAVIAKAKQIFGNGNVQKI